MSTFVELVDGGNALSHALFATSDQIYGYEGAMESLPLGVWVSKEGGRNAYGERVGLTHIASSGGGGALTGALTSGLAGTALLPAPLFPSMSPVVGTLTNARLPGVVHVVCRDGGEALATALHASSHLPSTPLLLSSTPQEAHDFALLTHALAATTSAPALHAMDAAALHTVEDTHLARYDALASLLPKKKKSKAPAATPAAPAPSPPTEASVVGACAPFTPLLHAPFTGVEYCGHREAECVLVAVGEAGRECAEAAAAAAAAASASTPGRRVGVLLLFLLSPWPSAAIQAALPKTLRALAILPTQAALATLPAFQRHLQAHPTLPTPTILASGGGSTASSPSPPAAIMVALKLMAALASGVGEKVGVDGGAGAHAVVAPSHSSLSLSPSYPAHPSLHNLSLAVWALGGGVDAWAVQASSPGALLPLLQHTYGVSSTATLTGKRTPGACGDGYVTRNTIRSKAAVGSGGPNAAASSSTDTVSCLVLTHPALLKHYTAVGSAVGGASGGGRRSVLVVLPPTLTPPPASPSNPNPPPVPPQGAAPLLHFYAPPSDLALLAAQGVHVYALALEDCIPVGVKGEERDRVRIFLTRAAILSVLLGGAILPTLTPALLASLHLSSNAAAAQLLPYLGALPKHLQAVAIPEAWAAAAAAPTSSTTTTRESNPTFPPSSSSSLTFAPGSPLSTPPLLAGPTLKSTLAPVTSGVHSSTTAARPHTVASPLDALALSLVHPAAYATTRLARPLVGGGPDDAGTYEVKVGAFRRLTPLDYDRNIFHIEFDTTGTGLTYDIGAALGVHGRNDPAAVTAFLAEYGVPGDTIVRVEGAAVAGEGATKPVWFNTAHRLLLQDLDLFGRPGKEFYEALAGYASHEGEARVLSALGVGGADGGDDVGFHARETEAYTYADVLREFPSARPPFPALAALLPRIKPRHYSIASSYRAHPHSVHLLVVEVAWTTPKGRAAFGHTSHYLAGLRPGDAATVSVLHSEMHLPTNPGAPVFMAGLGTGMAPFRAFIQERIARAAAGEVAGPMTLYFGARHRAQEYLYGDELEAAAATGLLTLRLAFSRDTGRKVYIQHLMGEDGNALWSQLGAKGEAEGGGAFYLCGPTWPEADVENAIGGAFEAQGGLSKAAAAALIKDMKAEKRYVLEVY